MLFSDLKLPEHILRAIKEQGFTEPTQIQEKTIPLLLAGKDILGQSQTGSGKTAAFGLPILSKLTSNQGIKALILTPTRELCVQVSDALRKFSKHMRCHIVPVYGGVGIGPQLGAVKQADILVATPGRLLDLMERGVKLNTVTYLVLDEADRMLDMGFINDVEKIIRSTSKQRQTVLFSATLSPKLRSLVNKHMNSPVSVQAKITVDTSLLTEKVFLVQSNDKFSLLVHFLKTSPPGIAIVFCKTRHGCDKLAKKLRTQKIDGIAIHGGLPQNKRMNIINNLHKTGQGVLVATDVASRGLHIDNISHVYNYDLPQVSDDYVHRIGRTARAGQKGDAITFVTSQDVRDFKTIMRDTNRNLVTTPLPEFERIIVPEIKGDHHRNSQGNRRSFQSDGRRSFGRSGNNQRPRSQGRSNSRTDDSREKRGSNRAWRGSKRPARPKKQRQ
ncbi:helicase SNF2 [Candidatus Woesearchaeota archaeon CG10_big_fil_rev_8_21_14_0_10_37_12]|nr:MAG: helicase SNF2 [Candidatus Woesearchaeota archaeon CG10_big_fil_rev_8_21_14_0_10_37_12]